MNEWTSTPEFEDQVRRAFGVPDMRPEFIDQLYGELLRRAEVKHKSRRYFGLRPAWIAALAILSIVMIVMLVIGPQRVYAAVRQLFGYIPGVGLVDPSRPIRVLAEPVSITREGISITVTSATLTGDRTHIEYRIFGVPGSAYPKREDVMGCIQQPYLRLPDGTQLTPERDFPPIAGDVNEAVLVLPCIFDTLPGTVPENWELPLKFKPAPPDLTVVPVVESLPFQTPSSAGSPNPTSSLPAITPTPAANPLVLTKALDVGDKFILMGEFNLTPAEDASLPPGSWWVLKQVSITGDDGREVPQSYSNDFEEPTPSRPGSETWLYQLDKNFIPPLTITYTGEMISPVGAKEQAAFTFDAGANPQNGSKWTGDRIFKLGGYKFHLVSIETSQRGYSFHFKADPGASANAIGVDIDGYTPNCGGGGGGGEDEFPVEFDREVCYADLSGGPAFPHGTLKVVLNFQALKRQDQSFQVQWSPDISQSGPYSTPTPPPGVCLRSDSLASLAPAPPDLSGGKALMYEQVGDANQWGLVLYNLDGSGRQVVVQNGNWGALSPDGSRVAYSSTNGLIHVIDIATKEDKVLAGASGFSPHWSPDGKQVAYIGMGNGVINSVFVADTDGSPVRQVSDLSYEALIGWSGDGARLYFAVPFTGGAAWKVYAYTLNGGGLKELFTIENGTPKFLNPKISPDGKWIAYRDRDNSSVYLVHADGSDMHLVLDNLSAVGMEWSRSGWLGISLNNTAADQSTLILIKPDGCEAYRLPAVLQGELQGLFIP